MWELNKRKTKHWFSSLVPQPSGPKSFRIVCIRIQTKKHPLKILHSWQHHSEDCSRNLYLILCVFGGKICIKYFCVCCGQIDACRKQDCFAKNKWTGLLCIGQTTWPLDPTHKSHNPWVNQSQNFKLVTPQLSTELPKLPNEPKV